MTVGQVGIACIALALVTGLSLWSRRRRHHACQRRMGLRPPARSMRPEWMRPEWMRWKDPLAGFLPPEQPHPMLHRD